MKLQVEHLTVRYNHFVAVNDLSFSLDDGKLLCLLGPSGCGKSTVLNTVAGFLSPSEGRVLFDEVDVTSAKTESRDIGMVFQNYALYPHMTVYDNIAFPLTVQRVNKKKIKERVEQMAELSRITDILNRKPGEISGGQQQRVAISRALIKNPKLLLLDEPLSNLDARLRLEMREELRRIQRDAKTTAIFVTHDQEEAMSISDQVILMNSGVLQQNDTPQRLYSRPENVFVAKFLGSPPINLLDAVCQNGMLVMLDGALKIPVKGYTEGTSYLVGLRCEDLFRCEDASADICLKFESLELIGKEAIVRCSEAGQILRFLVPYNEINLLGDTVPVKLKRENLLVFDKETQKNIGGLNHE